MTARAESALVEARLTDAERALQEAAHSLGCGGEINDELLARYWLAEGVLLHLQGDEPAASDSVAAASRTIFGYWDNDYGPTLVQWYHQTVVARTPEEPGSIRLEPPLRDLVYSLDAHKRESPSSAPSGLHLVQIGTADGEVRFGRFVYVQPGEDLVLATGLTEDVPASLALAPRRSPTTLPDAASRPRKRSPVPLVASGGAALLAASTAGLALHQNGVMDRATSREQVETAFQHQKTYGRASYALVGVTAVGLGLHFAL